MEEPTLKTDIVTIARNYWSCLDPDHRHTTKEIAARCIALQSKPRFVKKWTRERIFEVGKRWDSGESFSKIGIDFGVSGCRISQIYRKYCDMKEYPFYQSVCINRALWLIKERFAGDYDKARQALSSGEIGIRKDGGGGTLKNIGKKTIAALRRILE